MDGKKFDPESLQKEDRNSAHARMASSRASARHDRHMIQNSLA
jgi:hypothetical protein